MKFNTDQTRFSSVLNWGIWKRKVKNYNSIYLYRPLFVNTIGFFTFYIVRFIIILSCSTYRFILSNTSLDAAPCDTVTGISNAPCDKGDQRYLISVTTPDQNIIHTVSKSTIKSQKFKFSDRIYHATAFFSKLSQKC